MPGLKQLFVLLLCIVSLAACEKEDDTVPVNNLPAEDPKPAVKVLPVYFKGIINNVPLALETNFYTQLSADSVTNGSGGGSRNSTVPTDTLYYFYNSTIRDHRKNKPKSLTVYFANYYNYGLGVPYVTFDNIFKPGTRSFKYEISKFLGQSVAIQYRDEQGIYWSTAKEYMYASVINLPKPPTFSGQTFELISVLPEPDLTVNPRDGKHILANIKFNCYLYNSTGDSIKVENAEFQGVFHEINP